MGVGGLLVSAMERMRGEETHEVKMPEADPAKQTCPRVGEASSLPSMEVMASL